MSEEAINGEAVDEPIDQTPEHTEEELEALDSGWNPEGKDKDGNTLSAKEFMARKPLFNKINNMKGDMEALKAQLAAIQEDSMKMGKAFLQEKADLLEQLKEKREAALDNLDTDAVRKLDKQIEKVNETKQEAKENSPVEWEKPYLSFVKENQWYATNDTMRGVADLIGKQYYAAHPNTTPTDLYKHVAEQMKTEFPELDKNKSQEMQGSKVSGATRRNQQGNQKKAVKLTDFTPEEQRVIETMAKAVKKTPEEYLKNYNRG